MAEIEFLESAPGPRPAPPEPEPELPQAGPGLPLRSAAATAGWLAAAGLAVVAAFQQTHTIGFGSGATAFRTSVDAWGRVSVSGPIPLNSDQHGPRYGVAFCVCAAAFTLLAAWAAGGLIRGRTVAHQALMTAFGAAGAAGLAGVLAAVALQVQSTLSTTRAEVRHEAGLGDPVRGDLITSTGPAVALGLGALGFAVLAVLIGVARKRSADVPGDHVEAELAVLDDEDLPDIRSHPGTEQPR